MKGIGHTMGRVLRSGTFIAVAALVLFAIIFLGVVGFAESQQTRPINNFYDGIVSYNGSLYFDSYITNYLGTPLFDKPVNFTIAHNSSESVTRYHLSTDSSGYANASLGTIDSLNSSVFTLDSPLGNANPSSYTSTKILIAGFVPSSVFSMGLVRDSTESPYSYPMIVYFNQSGGESPTITVFYSSNDMSGYVASSENETLGTLSNFHTQTVPEQFGNNSFLFGSFWITLQGNNTVLAQTSGLIFSVPPGYSEGVSLFGFLGPLGGFLLVVMGLAVTEMTYTQDEGSGAFWLSLSKGRERRDLLLDRYAASATVIGGFTMSAIGFLEIASILAMKSWLSASLVESLLFGWEVPVLCIIAFPFLFGKSTHLKSLGTILVFFSFVAFSVALWAIAGSFYGYSASRMPIFFKVAFFLSPINYLALFVNSFHPGLGSLISMWFVPSDLTVNAGIVISSGLLWIILPAVLFYYLGNRNY